MLHSFMIKLALLLEDEVEVESEGVSFSLAPQASLTFSRESKCFDPLGGVGRTSTGLGPSDSTGTSGAEDRSFSMVFSFDWARLAPIVFAPNRSTKDCNLIHTNNYSISFSQVDI